MIEMLPKSLRDIASAIGFESVMLIVERYGSQRLWIPRQPPHDWILFKLLGHEAACKLIALCGGNQLEIPSCLMLKIELRNQKIRDDMQDGISLEKLTLKYRLRREQIRKILKRENV